MPTASCWGAAGVGFGIALLCIAAPAAANVEPGAYDTRSVGMGGTGVSFIGGPSAIAINPANLREISRFSFSLMFNPLVARSTAPVRGGDNPSLNSKPGFGPIGALFVAGRINKRAVVGVGTYLLVGFGSSFQDVTEIEGVDGLDGDIEVQFFAGELAFAGSVELAKWVSLGLALRVPFSQLRATLFAEAFPDAAPPISHLPVEVEGFGLGKPAGRVGFLFDLGSQVNLGLMYRSRSTVNLNGEASATFAGATLMLPADTEWRTPHAVAAEVSARFLDDRLLTVAMFRAQFTKQTNQRLIVDVSDSPLPAFDQVIVPLRWRNSYIGKFGVEYAFSPEWSGRTGYSFSTSSITEKGALAFTPPGGISHFATIGASRNWERFSLDFAFAAAWGAFDIPEGLTVPDESRLPGEPGVCEPGDLVKVGCPGRYEVLTLWASIQLVYRL